MIYVSLIFKVFLKTTIQVFHKVEVMYCCVSAVMFLGECVKNKPTCVLLAIDISCCVPVYCQLIL